MKKLPVGLAIAALLTGCATLGQLESGLNNMLGQDLSVAVAQLGFPNAERNVAGMRLVEWGRSNAATIAIPTTSTTNGYVQSGNRFANYSATTTSTTPMTLNFQCHITMQVDTNNIIRRFQYEGNLGGCAPYIRAMKTAGEEGEYNAAARRMQG
jgi:uncharacterized protein YceK